MSVTTVSSASKKRKHGSSNKPTAESTDEKFDGSASTAKSAPTEVIVGDQDNNEGLNDGQQAEQDDEEEVEAISHAEARKRRKLLKKQGKSKTGTDNVDTDEGKSEGNEDLHRTSPKEDKAIPSGNQKRSQHGVWVGNMSFKTNEERIREYFKACGPITRLHMPKGKGKFEYNRGFCYIDFDSPDSVEDAVALSEGHLDGRRLLIKNSKSFEGRPAPPSNAQTATEVEGGAGKDNTQATPIGSSSASTNSYGLAEFGVLSLSKTAKKILDRQKQPPAPTLFVGNLGFEVVVEDIQSMIQGHLETSKLWTKKEKKIQSKTGAKKIQAELEENGAISDAESKEEEESAAAEEEASTDGEEEVEEEPTQKPSTSGIRKIRLGTFEDTGKCKGWAFVDFHSIGQATLALIDGRNHQLNGRALKLEFGSQDAVRRGGGRMGTGEKRERPVRDGEGPRDKSKYNRKKIDKSFSKAEQDASTTNTEEEAGPHAVFSADTTYSGRAPLAANPYTAALISASTSGIDPVTGKAHKPNKAERAALRAQKAKLEKGGKRQKPGAALASAQRQNVSIVRGEGKKITFDGE